MFYNNDDIGKTATSQEMKVYCKLTTCRRKYLCEHFGADLISSEHHTCCDNCEKTCCCQECTVKAANETGILRDNHSHDSVAEKCIYNALLQYFAAVNRVMQEDSVMDVTLITCLTDTVAADIASKYEIYQTIELLQQNHNYLTAEYLGVIYSVMNECVEFTRMQQSEQ